MSYIKFFVLIVSTLPVFCQIYQTPAYPPSAVDVLSSSNNASADVFVSSRATGATVSLYRFTNGLVTNSITITATTGGVLEPRHLLFDNGLVFLTMGHTDTSGNKTGAFMIFDDNLNLQQTFGYRSHYQVYTPVSLSYSPQAIYIIGETVNGVIVSKHDVNGVLVWDRYVYTTGPFQGTAKPRSIHQISSGEAVALTEVEDGGQIQTLMTFISGTTNTSHYVSGVSSPVFEERTPISLALGGQSQGDGFIHWVSPSLLGAGLSFSSSGCTFSISGGYDINPSGLVAQNARMTLAGLVTIGGDERPFAVEMHGSTADPAGYTYTPGGAPLLSPTNGLLAATYTDIYNQTNLVSLTPDGDASSPCQKAEVFNSSCPELFYWTHTLLDERSTLISWQWSYLLGTPSFIVSPTCQ